MKLLKFITKHNLQYYLICLLVVLACFDRRNEVLLENNITNSTVSKNVAEITEVILSELKLPNAFELPTMMSDSLPCLPEPITIDMMIEKNEDLQEVINDMESKPVKAKALGSGMEIHVPSEFEKELQCKIDDMIKEYEKENKAKRGKKNSESTQTIVNEKSNGIEEYNGAVLNNHNGRIQGPSGQETWYNLPMDGVIKYMRNRGYDYEYWVRADGVKMFGEYVMVAANLEIRPKGTLVPTSLGMGIVCDTGGFAKKNIYQLDIATSW